MVIRVFLCSEWPAQALCTKELLSLMSEVFLLCDVSVPRALVCYVKKMMASLGPLSSMLDTVSSTGIRRYSVGILFSFATALHVWFLKR